VSNKEVFLYAGDSDTKKTQEQNTQKWRKEEIAGKEKGEKSQGKGRIRERGGKELGEVECIQTNSSKIKNKLKVKIGELK